MFLDEAEVGSLITMRDLISCMEKALIAFSQGKVTQPVRQFVNISEHNGFFGLMPAVEQDMGIKLVTFYPDNGARGLHTHHALILLFKPDTGEPLAVMDGRLITEMRTAAVSAAATNALAAPSSEVLTILGAGLQARAHIEALSLVREFKEIRIWARVPERAQALAEEVGGVAMAAEDAVRGADVIATTTAATEPVLAGAWLKPGAHVNAIGWNGPDARELDDDAMTGNVVVVESRDAAADQAGNVRGSGCDVYAEIGEVLSGAVPARADETTIFDTVGMAIEDVASAGLVYQRALEC
jgi:thiomorpholine-carboxylate dehydrogenase